MLNQKPVNNPTTQRNTHSSSAKNCFQAGPRSLYGVNYLLMRDVLVTFMYVLLAGGRLRALLGDADSPALFVHHTTRARRGTARGRSMARRGFLTRLDRRGHDDACPERGLRVRTLSATQLRPPSWPALRGLRAVLGFWLSRCVAV